MRISLNQKKIRPDIDNSKIFNRAIELAKNKDTLVFPKGRFPTWETVIQQNKQLFWEGSVEGTEIACAHDQNGVVLTAKGHVPKESFLSNLTITNALNNHDNHNQDGLTCNIPTMIEHVEISNFYGNGAVFTGDVVTAPGTNSRGYAKNLRVISCRGNGIYIQGGDSNCSQFEYCDLRDNWKDGFHDRSFLGVLANGVMAHNNQRRNFTVFGSSGNRSVFNGCYSEDGSENYDYFEGAAVIVGGMWSKGFILETAAMAFDRGKILTAPYYPHGYTKKKGTEEFD